MFLNVKELGVYIVVKGLLAAHELIYMIKIDLMERLTHSLPEGVMMALILAIVASSVRIPVRASGDGLLRPDMGILRDHRAFAGGCSCSSLHIRYRRKEVYS